MALRTAPPPLSSAAPPGSAMPERDLAEQRSSGAPPNSSAMEHLRMAGQNILAAAKQNPAVAEGAGEVISLLTKLTQAAMQQTETGEDMEGAMPPGPPPMGGPPMMA